MPFIMKEKLQASNPKCAVVTEITSNPETINRVIVEYSKYSSRYFYERLCTSIFIDHFTSTTADGTKSTMKAAKYTHREIYERILAENKKIDDRQRYGV